MIVYKTLMRRLSFRSFRLYSPPCLLLKRFPFFFPFAVVSSGKGSEVTLEIQKLLVEKKELEEEDDLSSEYSTSSESSSSSDSGPAEGTGEEAKDDAKDEEESESEDSEPELDARDTLWGQMEKRKTKKTSSTKPKNELTMSKQERTALKSKLMSELVELKQQSPYNRKK